MGISGIDGQRGNMGGQAKNCLLKKRDIFPAKGGSQASQPSQQRLIAFDLLISRPNLITLC